MTMGRAPFGPDELPLESGDAANLATSLRIGRELDGFAADTSIEPSADFTTRVMAAVAQEPTPRPVAAASRAVAAGRPLGFLAALRDSWRVATTGGRPALIRAQALAFVLVAFLTVGGVAGFAGAAALRLLDPDDVPPPAPIVAPTPTPPVSPTPTPTPTSTPTSSPTKTAHPTVRPTPTPPRRTPTPTPTGTDDHGGGGPGATDDHGGGSGSGSGGSGSGSGSDGSGSGKGTSGG
ncbi:MAG: hypothetical protein ACJ77B_04595 [Chloroflexota bacterium]